LCRRFRRGRSGCDDNKSVGESMEESIGKSVGESVGVVDVRLYGLLPVLKKLRQLENADQLLSSNAKMNYAGDYFYLGGRHVKG
jgi:hypothetical protein